jgi:hypothetical protein
MLNQLMGTILSVLVRLGLLLAGLVFLVSLLAAASLLLLVWLLRALWAKLTGQPVRPWIFQVNRQAMWSRFYRPPGPAHAPQRDDSNVIDVEPKEIKPPGR